MTNRFHTIEGETLTKQPIKPIQFAVDGLLSQVLYLLAGVPESGKSWLALWRSVTVAKGEADWNNRIRKRIIRLSRDDSADGDDKNDTAPAVENIDPADPIGTESEVAQK